MLMTVIRITKTAAAQAMAMVVVTMLILGVNTSWGQKLNLTQEAQAALDYFLNQDCAVGEKHPAVDRLIEANRQTSGGIESALRDILLVGPSADSLNHLREEAERNWTERQAFLAKGKNLGLTDIEVKRLRAEPKDAYVDHHLKRYKERQQLGAIIGLAAIGSDTAHAALTEARKTGDAETQAVIDAAVKHPRSSAVNSMPRKGT
jgi:hypothetical protein